MIGIGIMSGTSADGVDAACLRIEGAPPAISYELLSFVSLDMPADLREDIFRSFRPETSSSELLCQLNFRLGEIYAEAAIKAAEAANLPLSQIDFIGNHGQTVWHVPPQMEGTPSTLQLGSPAVIAQRTGCTVVSDFRSRDMAAGGQGAPLVPYVDSLLLSHPTLHRAAQNIGGIGNVTYLPPAGQKGAFGFDTGPGNMLMDYAAGVLTDGKLTYDKNGALAASGKVCEDLLAEWMRDPYFAIQPPKSTGREYFGVQRGAEMLEQCRARGLSDGDMMATLTAFTAESIVDAYRRFLPCLPDEVLVCGGGSRNPVLMQMIAQRLPGSKVMTTDDAGLRSDAKEAAAFAILAYETMNHRPGTLPAATGASEAVMLGSITFGK